ncbi:hypothetical protein [Alkaliphilus crotonatoxidans]
MKKIIKSVSLISLLIAIVLIVVEYGFDYHRISFLKYFFIGVAAILSILRELLIKDGIK